MAILPKNKRALRISTFLCLGSIFLSTMALFGSNSFQQASESFLEQENNNTAMVFASYAAGLRIITAVFLVFTAICAFSWGRTLIRISNDLRGGYSELEPELRFKSEPKSESEPQPDFSKLNSQQELTEYSRERNIKNDELFRHESNNNQHHTQKLCKKCKKEIYYPYRCLSCLGLFCNEHIFPGDHICHSNH